MDENLKCVHEMDCATRDAAIAEFTKATGSAPDFGLPSDRAWLEGWAYANATAPQATQPQAPDAPPTHAGLLAAAAHIQAKAQAHAEECGSYDPATGAVEMSNSNQEHFNTLDELAEEIRLMADKVAPCDKPPSGWTCSRAPGHDGPCAAAPAAPDERDAEIAGLSASVGHLSALVDGQHALLKKAKAAMTALHGAALPVNESRGDLDARIPASAFARFVEAHAELLDAMAQSPVAAPAAPSACRHRIADARTPFVKSGYICIDCGALFSAADHHGPAAPAAPAVDALTFEQRLSDWQHADALDAARYRWLREQEDADFKFAVVKNPHFDVFESATALDAAIDAAIQAAQGAE